MSLTALLLFIRVVITVVISVTDLVSWDAAAVASTLKLVVRARYRVILITFVMSDSKQFHINKSTAEISEINNK